MKKNIQSPTIYQIVFLIRKSKKEDLTATELSMLKEWLDRDTQNLDLYNKLLSENHSRQINEMLDKNTLGRYNQITAATRAKKVVRWSTYGSLLAAASIAIHFLFTPFVSEKTEDSIVPEEGETDLITLSTGTVREDLTVRTDSVYEVTSLLKEGTIKALVARVKDQPITIRTPIGKTIAFKLQDGSTVYLNSSSQISFRRDFKHEDERRVALNGEAFFVVSKDDTKPFIVENNGNEVKVLGTSFNVNGYGSRSKFSLGLATGKVEVKIKELGYAKTLTPGYEVTYDNSDGSVVQRTRDIARIGLWRTGVYAFEAKPILELTKDLEQMYPIHFVYDGPKPEELFNGEIVRDDDWKKVLTKLEMTNRVRFEVAGDKIIVRRHEEEKEKNN